VTVFCRVAPRKNAFKACVDWYRAKLLEFSSGEWSAPQGLQVLEKISPAKWLDSHAQRNFICFFVCGCCAEPQAAKFIPFPLFLQDKEDDTKMADATDAHEADKEEKPEKKEEKTAEKKEENKDDKKDDKEKEEKVRWKKGNIVSLLLFFQA
jgi:hypothetical protein